MTSFVAVFLTLILLTGCFWEEKKPSVLVVAVDSLPFEAIRCNEYDKNKGFNIVCNEMVRFTHAYSPSTLSQPSLASLLTGKYPIDHRVWNNGGAYLSAKFLTSSEVAVQNDYKTLFVSGGAPAWRHSGLEQGFEIFEDNISIDFRRYYRDSLSNIRIFLDWLNKQNSEDSFFTFLFLNDLQYPDFPTIDNEGFPREKTYEGQLREIDETLETLFDNLKKSKKWNSTWIVFVGTNGVSKEIRLNEAIGTNLFHENTNVSLFIKPPSKEEHPKGIKTVDENVSLVDVGRLLFEIFNSKPDKSITDNFFNTISLKEYFENNVSIPQSRPLLFESGWPLWRNVGSTKFAIQVENYLIVKSEPPKLYNTLVDRNQVYPIEFKNTSYQSLVEKTLSEFKLIHSSSYNSVPQSVIQKFRLSHAFIKKEGWNDDYYPEVKNFLNQTQDLEIAGWLASYYIFNSKWDDLKKLSEKYKNRDWEWVADLNLLVQPKNEPNECLKATYSYDLIQSEKEFMDQCKDSLLLELFSYLKSRGRSDKRDSLFKNYRQFKSEFEIQRINYQNGFIWDTRNNLVIKPHNLDLLLATPKYERVRKRLDTWLQR